MSTDIMRRTLKTQRMSLTFWTLGLVTLVVITLAFWPTMRDSPEIAQAFDTNDTATKIFTGGFTDLTSPAGYLNSQLFAAAVPILLLIYAIGRGVEAVAGEEDRGTLGLALAHPISRRAFVVQKAVSLIVGVGILSSALFITLAIGVRVMDMGIDLLDLAEVIVMSGAFGVAMGMAALAVGALRAGRGFAIGLASGIGVLSYFLNAFGTLNETLQPMRYFSPFYYAIGADPLVNGIDPVHFSILVGISAGLLALSVWGLERRDIQN